MKFFNFVLISSSPFGYWVYPDGVLGTPEPSHRLYFLYSKLHILLPKSVVPNTACSRQETPVEEAVKFALSTSLPIRLCSGMADIQHEYAHDLCSQHLSVSSHSPHCIFEQPGLGNEPGRLTLVRGNGTSSPIQYGLLNDLRNGTLCDCVPFGKVMKFIETKVPAINCRVLTNV
jgi:hypothetical protein